MATSDAAEEVGRVRTALLATLAGFIAIAGAVFTGLSYRLNRAGQITERLRLALRSGRADARTAALLSLVRAVGLHRRWPRESEPRELEARIQAITGDGWLDRALARTIGGAVTPAL